MLDKTNDYYTEILDILFKSLDKKHLTVFLFGSRAKGNAHQYSDIDLALDYGYPIDTNLMDKVKYDLEYSEIPYGIDIVDLNCLTEDFKKLIVQTLKKIYPQHH